MCVLSLSIYTCIHSYVIIYFLMCLKHHFCYDTVWVPLTLFWNFFFFLWGSLYRKCLLFSESEPECYPNFFISRNHNWHKSDRHFVRFARVPHLRKFLVMFYDRKCWKSMTKMVTWESPHFENHCTRVPFYCKCIHFEIKTSIKMSYRLFMVTLCNNVCTSA